MAISFIALLCGCAANTKPAMTYDEKCAKLLEAARIGDAATINQMLDARAYLETRDERGDTPLLIAIKNHQAQAARLLLSRGALVHGTTRLEDTPLHVSIYLGDDTMAAILRENGAEETRLNDIGLTPAEMKHLPQVEIIVAQAAELLTPEGTWTNRELAALLYGELRSTHSKFTPSAIALKMITHAPNQLQLALLIVKLGIPDSEEKLVKLLRDKGDSSMADAFLNSGSTKLREGAERWAEYHGYRIITAPGSRKAVWSKF